MRKRAPARAAQRARGRTRVAPKAGEHLLRYEYDAAHRRVLLSIDTNGNPADLELGEEERLYVGSGYERVQGNDEAGPFTRHLYKVAAAGRQVAQVERLERTGVVVDVGRRYIHSDHLGSSQVITDEDGELVHVQRLDAFGAPVDPDEDPASTSSDGVTKNIRAGFTGHETDVETGLVNMGGRIYDPRIGRFMQADPIVQPGWSQTLNRYSYVANNPLNAVDPSGFLEDLPRNEDDTGLEEEDRIATWTEPGGILGPSAGGGAKGSSASGDFGKDELTAGEGTEDFGFPIGATACNAPSCASFPDPQTTSPPAPAPSPAMLGSYHGYSGGRGPENNGPPIAPSAPPQVQSETQSDSANSQSSAQSEPRGSEASQAEGAQAGAPPQGGLRLEGRFGNPTRDMSRVGHDPPAGQTQTGQTTPRIRWRGRVRPTYDAANDRTNVAVDVTITLVGITQQFWGAGPNAPYAGNPSITVGQHEDDHAQFSVNWFTPAHVAQVVASAGYSFVTTVQGHATHQELQTIAGTLATAIGQYVAHLEHFENNQNFHPSSNPQPPVPYLP